MSIDNAVTLCWFPPPPPQKKFDSTKSRGPSVHCLLNSVMLELKGLNIPLNDPKGMHSGQFATAFRKHMTGDDYLQLTKNVSTGGGAATYADYETTVLNTFFDPSRDSHKTVRKEYDQIVQNKGESVLAYWRRLSNAKDELKVARDRDASIQYSRVREKCDEETEKHFRQKFIDGLEHCAQLEAVSAGNKPFTAWVTFGRGTDAIWIKYIQTVLPAPEKAEKGGAQAFEVQEEDSDEKVPQPRTDYDRMTAMMQDQHNELHKKMSSLAEKSHKDAITLGKLVKEGVSGIKTAVEESTQHTQGLEKKFDSQADDVDELRLMLAEEVQENKTFRKNQGRNNPPPGSKYGNLGRDSYNRNRSPSPYRNRHDSSPHRNDRRDSYGRGRSPSPHRNDRREQTPRQGFGNLREPRTLSPFNFKSGSNAFSASSNDTSNSGNDLSNIPPNFKFSSVPVPIHSCWTCGSSDHFMDAPCPLASNMEVLVYLRNMMYRLYKHLPFDQFKTLFEKKVDDSGLKVTRDEATALHKFYDKFNQQRPRGKDLGPNKSQFCIYCYGTGHASRDCAKFCPYCLNQGHHWKSCTHPGHSKIVADRVASLEKHGSQAFLIAFDKYEGQCMFFCEDYETPRSEY